MSSAYASTYSNTPGSPVVVFAQETLAIVNATKTYTTTTPSPQGMSQSVAGLYSIDGYVSLTAAGTASVNVEVTWTDENNTAHTTQIIATASDGAVPVITALTTTGWRDFRKTIRARNGTTLSVLVAGTVTAVTYDFGVMVTLFGNL